jgi:hypothetical protein
MTLHGHGYLGIGNGIQMHQTLVVVSMTKRAVPKRLAQLSLSYCEVFWGDAQPRRTRYIYLIHQTLFENRKIAFAPNHLQVELCCVIPDGP